MNFFKKTSQKTKALIGAVILFLTGFVGGHILKIDKKIEGESNLSPEQIQSSENNTTKENADEAVKDEESKRQQEYQKMLAKLDDLAEKTKKGEITEDIANRYLELIENYDYVGDIFYSSKRTPYAAIGKEKNGDLCYGIQNLETGETSTIKYGYINSTILENDFIISYDKGGKNNIIVSLSTMEEIYSCKSTITIMPISYTSCALLKDSENNNSALYDTSTKEMIIPYGKYDEISITAHKYTIDNRDLTLFYVSKNGLYGIYDAESKKELTPCKYKSIYLLDIYFDEKGNIFTIAETEDDKTVTIDLVSGKVEEYMPEITNLNRAKPQY